MPRWVIKGGASWVFAGWEDGEALHCALVDQDWGKTRPVIFTDEEERDRTLAELRATYDEDPRMIRRSRFWRVELPFSAIIVDIDGTPLDRQVCWWVRKIPEHVRDLKQWRPEEVYAYARPDVPEVSVSGTTDDEEGNWGSTIPVNRPAVKVDGQWVRRCRLLKVIPAGRVC